MTILFMPSGYLFIVGDIGEEERVECVCMCLSEDSLVNILQRQWCGWSYGRVDLERINRNLGLRTLCWRGAYRDRGNGHVFDAAPFALVLAVLVVLLLLLLLPHGFLILGRGGDTGCNDSRDGLLVHIGRGVDVQGDLLYGHCGSHGQDCDQGEGEYVLHGVGCVRCLAKGEKESLEVADDSFTGGK